MLFLGVSAQTTVSNAGLTPQTRVFERLLAEVALDQAVHGPAITPIPLDDDGRRVHGVMYDPFLLGVIAGRAAIQAGRPIGSAPIGPDTLPGSLPREIVIVADALMCAGQLNPPQAVRIASSNGGRITSGRQLDESVRGAPAPRELVSGERIPASSLVAAFQLMSQANLSVEIDYALPACPGSARTVVLPLRRQPSRQTPGQSRVVKMPAELVKTLPVSTSVRVLLVADAAGKPRLPSVSEGPPELDRAAEAFANRLQFEPARVNGVGVPEVQALPLTFTSTSAPSPSPVRRLPPDVLTARLAIELAQEGDVVPIPLDADGSRTHGIAFDHTMLAQLVARAAFLKGTPLDLETRPPDFPPQDAVVVAFPLTCDGRINPPRSLQFHEGPGVHVSDPAHPIVARMLSPDEAHLRLPGAALPEESLVTSLGGMIGLAGGVVEITYAVPACPSSSATVSLPMHMSPLRFPPAQVLRFPDGISGLPTPSRVSIDADVDADGRLRNPTAISGPPELYDAALAEALRRPFEPPRINGAGVSTHTTFGITFTAGGPSSSSSVRDVSLTGSAFSGETTTNAVPALSTASSRCGVSSDVTYGVSVENPVRVGGEEWRGPARELKFIDALRGPQGQGSRYCFLGVAPAPDRKTFVDVYEFSYTGLSAPLRIFVDEYHFAARKAPRGLVCHVALDLR